MVRLFTAIITVFLFVCLAQAQDSGQRKVSLEDWDVGAVKVIVEPKPAPPVKGKSANGKQTAKDEKPSADKNDKNDKKTTTAVASKTKETPKDDSLVPAQVIDLLAMETGSDTATAPKTTDALSGRADLDKIIDNASKEAGVDPQLIYSVMRQESGFHNGAVSSKGAQGLMQLIPSTARRFGVKNVFDPKENVQAGAKYLRFLLDTFNGDVELALAGYNAGEGAVIRYGYRIPPYSETQNYVRSIVSKYGQRTPLTNVTAGIRINAPIIVTLSDKGGLMLSNSY